MTEQDFYVVKTLCQRLFENVTNVRTLLVEVKMTLIKNDVGPTITVLNADNYFEPKSSFPLTPPQVNCMTPNINDVSVN